MEHPRCKHGNLEFDDFCNCDECWEEYFSPEEQWIEEPAADGKGTVFIPFHGKE